MENPRTERNSRSWFTRVTGAGAKAPSPEVDTRVRHVRCWPRVRRLDVRSATVVGGDYRSVRESHGLRTSWGDALAGSVRGDRLLVVEEMSEHVGVQRDGSLRACSHAAYQAGHRSRSSTEPDEEDVAIWFTSALIG